MSKVIEISKEMLNKAFREHYSQYCDEFEFDDGFDDNIYLSYITIDGALGFCNKEEIEEELENEEDVYVFYHLFTEDLFEYIDVVEDYYTDVKVVQFKKEVEEGFKKLNIDVVIKIS